MSSDLRFLEESGGINFTLEQPSLKVSPVI